jgi:hypothetical protein
LRSKGAYNPKRSVGGETLLENRFGDYVQCDGAHELGYFVESIIQSLISSDIARIDWE